MGQGLDDYGTHFPILASAIARSEGPVLELGVGHYSTPMLHYLCGFENRLLVSADTQYDWLRKFADGYACPRKHEFQHVHSWKDWGVIEANQMWAVALVDCSPGEARAALVERLAMRCRFIVVHDTETDYNVGTNYGYEPVFKTFKFRNDFCRYRPYTTVVSNFERFPIDEVDATWKPVP